MKDLSVKIKLWVLVIISIIAILVLSIDKIFYGMAIKENIQITKYRILEAEALAKAVHFLQIERGLSVGFIANSGTKGSNEIHSIRKEVDNATSEIKRVFIITNGDISVLNPLNDLNSRRTSIDTLSINNSDLVEYYSKAIKTLLDATLIIPPLIDDKDGRNIIQAYTHLASVKEALGRIRANLNGAFTKDIFTDNAYFAFGGSLGAYNINLEKFKVLSSKEIQNFYESTYKGEAVDKTVAMMNIAKEKGMKGGFGVDSSAWFEYATASIDLLRKVELELYRNVYKLADDKIKEANYSLMLIVFVSILIIVALLISGYFVIENITKNISTFQQGLLSFFSFLSRETSNSQSINISSKDEFGQMAVVINKNISRAEAQMVADENFIQNVKEVMHRVENGWFSQHIEASTDNIGLLELKTIVNQALTNLRANFVLMNNTLEEYCNYDYTKELKIDNIESDGVFD
ncbi:MAG: nitrate- and nitrite sensing domain-containing protein, partial [Sulfurimonas sp.]|nr:nitrate- and nitrite sensing domain-containing protein [Sulfurimonas sp.]